ncbi:MAG TPA: hypothetical protein VEL47_02345, partial [Myxococcota bacterium]|nr:hypothetical protein [Myxococcota bacterium]
MWASDIAKTIGGRLIGENREINRLCSLFDATVDDLSFIIWPKDIRFAKMSRAGCLVAEMPYVSDFADRFVCSWIMVDDLYDAFVRLREMNDRRLFSGRAESSQTARWMAEDARVHESAVVLAAHIGHGVVIEAHVVVGDGCVIGDNTHIEAGAKILPGVHVGRGCRVGANSVIGSDGFVPWGLDPSKLLPPFGSVCIG